MARITVAGGSSNWREMFLSHPGLAVTPENYDLLLAEAAPVPGAPEQAAEPEGEVPAAPAVPRVPPRRADAGDGG